MKRPFLSRRISVACSFGLLIFASCQKTNDRQASQATSPRALQALATIGADAQFNTPTGVAADNLGNLYIADLNNNVIRKITSDGMVSTLAGTGSVGDQNGPAAAATFNLPVSLAVDASRNIYVAEAGSNRIRKISAAGIVSNYAGDGVAGFKDGQDSTAEFNGPRGVSTDGSGNVYVADMNNHRIRRITRTGIVSTLSGTGTPGYADGPGKTAQFFSPTGIWSDPSGNTYVADLGNHRIRKIIPSGYTSLVAGTAAAGHMDGPVAMAQFDTPKAITRDASGNIYVSDDYKLRKIGIDGNVTTVAGSEGQEAFADGVLSRARFSLTSGLATDTYGNVYLADYSNNRIRKLTGNIVSTVAGTGAAGYVDGPGASVKHLWSPDGLCVDYYGNVYIGDKENNRVVVVSTAGVTSTLIFAGGTYGYANGVGTAAKFSQTSGVALDAGGVLYIAEFGGCKIRNCRPTDQYVDLLAGSNFPGYMDATGGNARFNLPSGIDADNARNIYVADYGNHRIRKITPSGMVTTVIGNRDVGHDNGPIAIASINQPTDVKFDHDQNMFIADPFNNMIRKITPDGIVSTIAGNGIAGHVDGATPSSELNNPGGIAVDTAGNVYVADGGNNMIRKITPAGVVSTIAGAGTYGFKDGPAAQAQFRSPGALAVDHWGNIFVADFANQRIRKITPARVVSTVIGDGTAAF